MGMLMSTGELINIIAIVVGPIISVLISVLLSHHLQKRQNIRDEQYRIFIKLMENRYAAWSHENTAALNALPIVFCHDKEIVAAYNDYFNALSVRFDGSTAVIKRTETAWLNLAKRIATKLNYTIEQTTISNSYIPQGLADAMELNLGVMKSLQRVLDNTYCFITQQNAPEKDEQPENENNLKQITNS